MGTPTKSRSSIAHSKQLRTLFKTTAEIRFASLQNILNGRGDAKTKRCRFVQNITNSVAARVCLELASEVLRKTRESR